MCGVIEPGLTTHLAALDLLALRATQEQTDVSSQLHEWGLGGRSFGTLITWFLLGGDLYTAYTFIAVPALMFGAGATGFFAVPYAALMYPVLFMAFPRLWSVAHKHGYITAADFVRGRFGHRGLALAIAVTGLMAVMPYIALQLVGMQVVIAALGLDWAVHLPLLGTVSVPLIVAFMVLAAFTYTSGLRGTALIAVVKDILVYITVLAAIIIIPSELGGYGKVFCGRAVAKQLLLPPAHARKSGRGLCLCHPGPGFAAGAVPLSPFGDGAAVILQPPCHPPQRHGAAGLFGGAGADRAAGLHGDGVGRRTACRNMPRASKASATISRCRRCSCTCSRLVCRRCLRRHRHRRADARLDHGDRLRQSFHPQYLQGLHRRRIAAPQTEARVAKLVAFAAKLGALFFVLEIADHLRHPACSFWAASGSARPCRRCCWRCMCGWIRGRCWRAGRPASGLGTWMVMALGFKSSTYPLHLFGLTIPCYAAVSALVVNLLVSWLLTLILRATVGMAVKDETVAADYA